VVLHGWESFSGKVFWERQLLEDAPFQVQIPTSVLNVHSCCTSQLLGNQAPMKFARAVFQSHGSLAQNPLRCRKRRGFSLATKAQGYYAAFAQIVGCYQSLLRVSRHWISKALDSRDFTPHPDQLS
jgi:hypothetical protein